MIPNYVAQFQFNDEVEILDEIGNPTGKRGYVYAIYCEKDNDAQEYAVMLAPPFSGARHYPAALLRKVDKPATQRVQHVIQRKRKRRARQADDVVTTSVVILTGPPLPKQNASAATPRRRALQVRPHPQGGDAAIEHSTKAVRASSGRGAK